MDITALLIIGTGAIVVGALLLAIALPLARRYARRVPPTQRTYVTRSGVIFYLVQTLVALAIVGIGLFQPETLLGRAVTKVGATTVMVLACLCLCPIAHLLQRRGVLLLYRRPSQEPE
jgi:drug/metabolite transporter (DMT)-like permease